MFRGLFILIGFPLDAPCIHQSVCVPNFKEIDVEGDGTKNVPKDCDGVALPCLVNFVVGFKKVSTGI